MVTQPLGAGYPVDHVVNPAQQPAHPRVAKAKDLAIEEAQKAELGDNYPRGPKGTREDCHVQVAEWPLVQSPQTGDPEPVDHTATGKCQDRIGGERLHECRCPAGPETPSEQRADRRNISVMQGVAANDRVEATELIALLEGRLHELCLETERVQHLASASERLPAQVQADNVGTSLNEPSRRDTGTTGEVENTGPGQLAHGVEHGGGVGIRPSADLVQAIIAIRHVMTPEVLFSLQAFVARHPSRLAKAHTMTGNAGSFRRERQPRCGAQ